jgi:hypothetical protein|tara:strand:+ start:517 stop:744 length:228 start_codon:yes stop_codon:yes gene_type:complete
MKTETKLEVRRDTINQVRGLVESKLKDVGPVMDDHDGGSAAAFKTVLQDLDVYDMILDHHHTAEKVETYEDGADS